MSQLGKDEIMVSVIIPVFDRADIISDALNSLVNQSYKHFEVVIVDDGSTDNLERVVTKYSDVLRIAYVKESHSGNIAAVRNKGLSIAKGTYVAILDSDDVCAGTRFEKQLAYFENNTEADILASHAELFGNSDTKRHDFLQRLYNTDMSTSEMIKRFLNYGCCLCHSTMMVRKKVLDTLSGYDESYSICEDYDIWMRAIVEGMNIAILPEKLVKRRLHNDSVTNEYEGSEQAIRNVIRIKLSFLLKSGLISGKKVAVLGVNKRNEYVKECLSVHFDNRLHLDYLDIHNGLSTAQLNKYSYYFVTTYSRKREIFRLLQEYGRSIVKDYIYL